MIFLGLKLFYWLCFLSLYLCLASLFFLREDITVSSKQKKPQINYVILVVNSLLVTDAIASSMFTW